MKRKLQNTKKSPRRVDFLRNADDLRALVLGNLGFSTTCIENETGLSPSQITYRLGKASVKRANYRNGITEFSKIVLKKLEPTIAANVRMKVKKSLNGRR